MTTRENSRELTVVEQVCQTLKSPALQQQIRQALPPGVSIERFTRTTLIALQTNPSVLEADRQSLYNAIVRAAQDGLLADGREGALTVFNTNIGTKQNPKWVKKAQWMPMVFGLIQKLGKAGIDAYANSVYEGEKVEIWNDELGQHINHHRSPFGKRGELLGVYALGKTAAGRVYIEAMNEDDIEAARAKSKNPDSGPWKESYERMAQKSALHRLAKRMPITSDDERAAVDQVLKSEEENFDLTVEVPSAPAIEKQAGKRPAALQQVIDQTQDQTQAADEPLVPAQEPKHEPRGDII